MAKQEPFMVTISIDETTISETKSHQPLAKTLRLVADAIKGIAGAYAGIRYKAGLIAEMETNWQGRLSEVNIRSYQPVRAGYEWATITPINPRADMFGGDDQ